MLLGAILSVPSVHQSLQEWSRGDGPVHREPGDAAGVRGMPRACVAPALNRASSMKQAAESITELTRALQSVENV